MDTTKPKIFVVLVTYNRLAKLKIALNSYEEQSWKPTHIIVVNNNSSDGTSEYLKEWESSPSLSKHSVISSSQNLGGAGGFYLGMKKAVDLGAEWIWIADDDAYPANDALSILSKYIGNSKFSDVSCFCGTVFVGKSESIDTDHRRIQKKRIIRIPYHVPLSEYQKEIICIDEATYVGSCFKVGALNKAGLTNKDLFIYFDDTEHCHRIRKEGRILLIPNIKVFHDTASYQPPSPNVLATWRDYYLLRNHVYTLKHYHWITYIAYSLAKTVIAYKDYLLNGNKELLAMMTTAINDGKNDRLGLHPVYKPGYEVYKKQNGYMTDKRE